MLVQKKDLIYILENKEKHTPLECALALYGIQQHKALVKKNDENVRVKNFAFQIANKLRDLMFFLNGGGAASKRNLGQGNLRTVYRNATIPDA